MPLLLALLPELHAADRIARPVDLGGPSLAQVVAASEPGDRVVLLPGRHEGGIEIRHDLVLSGAGADATRVAGAIRVREAHLVVEDLTISATTGQPLLDAGVGSRVVLWNVVVEQGGSGPAVRGRDAGILAWNATLTGSTRALGARGGRVLLAGSRLEAEHALALDGLEARLEGTILVEGFEPDVENATLVGDHVTWVGDGYTLPLGPAELRNVLVVGFGGVSCLPTAEVLLDWWLLPEGVPVGYACDPLLHLTREDTVLLGEAPGPGSVARDGGDPLAHDLDGTRTDLGATGGDRARGTSPPPFQARADRDGDGLDAGAEWLLRTSDAARDSDGDGIDDPTEWAAGDDPADPGDHLGRPLPLVVRTWPGEEVELAPDWTPDPDGEPCTATWDDGTPPGPRTVLAEVPGRIELDWTLACGGGAARATAVVLAQETLRVPEDVATLPEALAAARDWTRVELATGRHVGPVELRAHGPLVAGSGPGTVVEGPVTLAHPLGALQDLDVDGAASILAGSALRVRVLDGDLVLGEGELRNVLVDGGDADLLRPGRQRHLTVDGDLEGHVVSLRHAVVTGMLRLAGTVTHVHAARSNLAGVEALADDPFLFHADDPWEAILEPRPDSPLWDVGPGRDVDGSPEDVGATGGPEGYLLDGDGDGLSDAWEALHGQDDPAADTDGDGLDALAEYLAGTDPDLPDTDGDGIPDAEDHAPTTPAPGVPTVRLVLLGAAPTVGEVAWVDGRATDDPWDRALSWRWRAQDPDGEPVDLLEDGLVAGVPLDRPGTWTVTLEVEAGPATASASIEFSVDATFRVADGQDLQAAIDAAPAGATLELEPGLHPGSVTIDRDLVLVGVGGPTEVGLDGTDAGPVVSLAGPHRLVLRGLTLWTDADQTGLEALAGGTILLEQVRIVGGWRGLSLTGAELTARSAVVLATYTLLEAMDSTLTFRNAALGWPASDRHPAATLLRSTLRLESTVVDWRGEETREPLPLLQASASSEASAWRSLLVGRSAEDTPELALEEVGFGEPGFLLDPWDAPSRSLADFRLLDGAAARDAGVPGDPDIDGTPNDIGPFGGALGDWPGIDDDRDGYTNLEGDCDDGDPQRWPDREGLRCPGSPVAGCGVGGAGGGGGIVLAALLALLVPRRRDHPPLRG